MKNVLIVSAVFPPEPVTSATLNYDLAVELSNKYNVTVITPRPSRPSGFDFKNIKYDVSEKFKHIVIESYIHPTSSFVGRLKESISFGINSARYISKNHEKIDFVYNDGWQLFGLYIVAKVCVKYKIPYIVPIQDIYPESILTKIPNICGVHLFLKLILGLIDKYYLRHASIIRTITRGMASYLSKTRDLDISKFIEVANWQSDDSFNDYRSQFRKEGKIIFMFVGNNNKQANVELIIKAFYAANLENAELRIMGDGNAKNDCISLVEELGCKNISFDIVPVGMVAKIQKEADVMVLALKSGTGKHGVPSKLTAYMLSGKPIIASMDTDADAAHMILDANAGFVTEADNVEKFSELFRKMAYISINELEIMGNNSRKFADKKLTKEVNLRIVCKSVDLIINNNKVNELFTKN